MEVARLAPGLWRWTAPHPAWTPEQGGPAGWPQEVGSVYCEREGGILLFDPLAPPAGSEDAVRFWDALDKDVERVGGRIDVLLGNRYHGRSAAAVRERYSARFPVTVRAHRDAAGALAVGELWTFGDGEILPRGVEAMLIEGLPPGEVVYYLPDHRAALFADSVLGAGQGRVRLPPQEWAPSEPHHRLRSSLRPLLERPLDSLLVSHGEIVLRDARRALAEALDE